MEKFDQDDYGTIEIGIPGLAFRDSLSSDQITPMCYIAPRR